MASKPKHSRVIISVPGKIHLIGEHAVVHGYPAIIAAINLYVTGKISTSKTKEILIEKKPADKRVLKLAEIIEKAVKHKFKIANTPTYRLEIESAIPIGRGLGSSAALSAVVTASLLKILKIEDYQSIEEIAYLGEKFFHGNPSGGDLAAVISGNLIWFRKENELIKIIKPLPFSPSKKLKPFILIDSGKPKETTKFMVEIVQKMLNKSKEKVQSIFRDQESLSRQMPFVLKSGKEKELVTIIKKAHRNLTEIGVVSPRACDIVAGIEKIGGAAKISGAGGKKDGSGMLLCYNQNPQKLLKFAENYNLPVTKVKISSKGFKLNEG